MAIKNKVSQIKVVAGSPTVVSQAVPTSAEALSSALEESLKSLKFVPLISSDKSYADNENELARAKSVLDQICLQAQEIKTRQEVIDLITKSINESDIKVEQEIIDQLVSHIAAQSYWKKDTYDQEPPKEDDAKEQLQEMLDKLITPITITQEPSEIAEIKSQPEASETSDLKLEDVSSSLEMPKETDLQSDEPSVDLDGILAKQFVPQQILPQNKTGFIQLDQINNMPSPESNLDKIKRFLMEFEQLENENQKSKMIKEFVNQNPGLRNNPKIAEIINGLASKTELVNNLTEDHRRMNDQLAAAQLTQQPPRNQFSQPPYYPQNPGFGLNFNFGGSNVDKAEKEARTAFKSVNKQMAKTSQYLQDRVRAETKIEKTLADNGVEISYDADGRWSKETLLSIDENAECKSLMKNLQATERKIDDSSKSLLNGANQLKMNGNKISEDILKETLENSNNLLDKSKKAKKNHFGEDPSDNRQMLQKLAELIQKMIDYVLKMLGFKSKKDYEDSHKERREPVIDTDNLAPQP